jgi:hypothetical protein
VSITVEVLCGGEVGVVKGGGGGIEGEVEREELEEGELDVWQ